MGRFFSVVFKIIGTLFLIGCITGCLFLGMFYLYITGTLMKSEEANITLSEVPVNLSSTVYYYDKQTGTYQEWMKLATQENRTWLGYKEIPKKFVQAFVSIEDERFWSHHGVDWKRTAGAALRMFTGQQIYGGSTITQQLIKNVTQRDEVTVKRKLLEICSALQLENTYSKEEILEWYMNIIYFGRGQYGICAAARYYFGKDVEDLTLAEMCSIVGITNNPSKYDPYIFPENNLERRNVILDKMLELHCIDEEMCAQAKSEPLTPLPLNEHNQKDSVIYPYYIEAVIDDALDFIQETYSVSDAQAAALLYHGGYSIFTCVDMDIQNKIDAVYQNVDNFQKNSYGEHIQSSMVVMDPYTGDILGMAGGVGEKKVNRGVNWASSSLARRAPGSSFKPIATYGQAIEYGLITPNTEFLDSDKVKLKGTDWLPKNDSLTYSGVVTVRKAIINSLNTVAAQVMDLVTPSRSYQFLKEKLHMDLEPEDEAYAPMALGQLYRGTTARQMASAYTIFPSGGTYRQGRTFTQIIDSKGIVLTENEPVTEEAVISPKTAYWITDMLQDAVRYGTGTGARLSGMHCAGKTGTSTDKKDKWFVGYTPYYVCACWTGYEDPQRIPGSANPACGIWKQVMTAVHEGLTDKDFAKPEDTKLNAAGSYVSEEAKAELERKKQEEEEAKRAAAQAAAEEEQGPSQEIPDDPNGPIVQPEGSDDELLPWVRDLWENQGDFVPAG